LHGANAGFEHAPVPLGEKQTAKQGATCAPDLSAGVAAEAIVYAATHNRREVYVGMPTVKAIIGNKIAPGYADRHLLRMGYDSQQTNEPADPQQPNNLMQPLPGDHGAHGAFDHRSRRFSPQLWATKRRGLLLGASALAGAALMWSLVKRGENGHGNGS
jgi:hypothetical protein